jgi:ferritin
VINPKMQDALNAQINAEQYSAQLYLAMSAHCASINFRGFAKWLRIQADEETQHAMKLIDFVLDRSGRLELKPIPAPATGFHGPLQVFEKVLDHEREVTVKIHGLFETARSEKDYASEITLQWYVTEQVEEEARALEIVERMRAIGDKGGAIWYLDKEMGKRSAAA